MKDGKLVPSFMLVKLLEKVDFNNLTEIRNLFLMVMVVDTYWMGFHAA